MKSILLYLLTIFLFIPIDRQYESDSICWDKDYKLTWDDFNGIPEKGSKFEAISCISFENFYVIKGNYVFASFKAVFVKSKSWVKDKSIRSKNLLNHEQGHFDLAELYTRRIREASRHLKINEKNCYRKINKIFYSIKSEYESVDKQYDRETNFSLDTISQKKWNDFLNSELKKYEVFSDSIVQIPIR